MRITITRPLTATIALSVLLFACSKDPEPTADMATSQPDMSSQDMNQTTPAEEMGGEEDMSAAPDQGEDMTPPVEEGLRIQGLDAKVKVSFDAQGVLHLECETNHDCFAAQGYYHAAHRFAQMDLRRRLGRGRLSTLVAIKNEGALLLDIETRKLLSTRDGDPLEEHLLATADDETRADLEAYTRGVNAWLADLEQGRNGAQLSEEYDFAVIDAKKIPAWEPEDSIAVGLLFLNSLMDIASTEIAAGEAAADFEPAFLSDLYTGAHLDPDSPIITSAGETYTALGANSLTGRPAPLDLSLTRERLRGKQGVLSEARRKLEKINDFRGEGPFGSNSWATAPALNAEDHAILSNDPHLALTNPALWYLAEIDAKTNGSGTFHAAGVSFAGVPGIMIGHSEEVAWSATVAYWDLVDVYVEELSADGKGVVRDGATVAFIEREQTFDFANGTQDETLLFVPNHGPVLSIDEEAGTAITLKSVLADTDLDLKLFLSMGKTASLDEAKELLSGSTAAGFNFVLIDRGGNIAYYPFAGIPRREWDTTTTPAWMPLPGNGDYEWGETLIRADELPQLENPSANFIATANAAITDDMLDGIPGNEGYPPLQSTFIAPGARQARVVDVIEASTSHTRETHAALQGDTHLWIAEQMLPEILSAARDAGLGMSHGDLLGALESWDYTCPTGLADSDPMTTMLAPEPEASASIGCAAFHVTLATLTGHVVWDEYDAQEEIAGRSFGRSRTSSTRILYWLFINPERLQYGEAYWDDRATEEVEDRAAALTGGFAKVEENLEALFGSSDPNTWRWGRIHTLTLDADLLSTLTDDYNHGPYAAPGGLWSVNVASPSGAGLGKGFYGFGAGASMRMVVEGKADGFTSTFNLPGGQIHRRDSAFYDHLLGEWLTNDSFEMPFTREAVEAAAMEKFEIEPATP